MASDLPAAPASRATRTRLRPWLGRLLLGLGAPLGTLLVLEGLLQLTGFGRSPHFFIPDAQPGFYRTNPHFTETFFPTAHALKPVNFRLSRQKPAGVVRVFVFGESAAMGVPEPGFGLAPQLRAQLRAAFPKQTFEVYPLGVGAINSHVIRLIAREAAGFEPDVFVLYAGNNEVVGPFGPGSGTPDVMLFRPWIRASIWARSTRTGQLLDRLWQSVHRLGGAPGTRSEADLLASRIVAATDPRLERVYQNFHANLADILQVAKNAGAKVVLSTIAVNLADCAPFASVHRAGLSAAELATWQETIDRAVTANDLGHAAEAEALFTRALQIDPGYAATEFRLARVFATQGGLAAAKTHYRLARQLDALRLRADARINAIIRAAVRFAPDRIVLVDAAGALGASATTTAPISDHHSFFDHVHLTWEGNHALARAIAPAVAATLFGADTSRQAWLDSDACAERMGFTPIARTAMLSRMNELMRRAPFTAQLTFAADRTAMQAALDAGRAGLKRDDVRAAVATIETALANDPRNAFLTFHAAAANGDAGNVERALELNAHLPELEPPSADDLDQQATLLAAAGRADEAERVLLESARLEPYHFETYTVLGQLWANGKLGRARRYFAALVGRMPGEPDARLAYAQTLVESGEWTAAEEQLRLVLQRAPDNENALEPLARRLLSRGRSDAALNLMLKAYAYNPRSFANNERLAHYYASQRDKKKTVEFLGAMEESGAVPPAVHADRGALLLELGRRTEALVEFVQARHAAETAGDAKVLTLATDAIRDNKLTDTAP